MQGGSRIVIDASGPVRIEKAFVLDVFRTMGITLSPAERREFDKRPTQNLSAFLAFSRGLMAQDAGRMDEAARFFDGARSLDPGFGAALQKAQAAASAQAGAQVSSTKVESGLKNSAEGSAVASAHAGSTSDVSLVTTLNAAVGDVNPTITNTVQSSTGGTTGTGGSSSGTGGNAPQTQNQVAQTTGTNQPAQQVGKVTIVITRPPGGLVAAPSVRRP